MGGGTETNKEREGEGGGERERERENILHIPERCWFQWLGLHIK